MIKCLICGEYKKRIGHHIKKTHDMKLKDYYDNYIKIKEEGICLCCKNNTSFLGLTKGYSRYCSYKCSSLSIKVINKRKETAYNKYGNENYRNIEQNKKTKKERYEDENYNNRKKCKKTKQEKYGDENYNNIKKTEEIKLKRYGNKNYNNRKKAKQTCLIKYGVSHISQAEFVKNKKIETNNKNNQVSFPLQSLKIKNKVKQTNLKKYGVEWQIISDTTKKKAYNSIEKRYGVKHIFQSEKIKEKVKQTNLDKYGVDNPSKLPEVKEKIRIARLKEIEEKHGQIIPNYNPVACKIIEGFNKFGYNFQHAENGGEICVAGYFPDGLDEKRKLIVEIDESHHYDSAGNLRQKDAERQQYLEKQGYTVLRVII